MNYKECLKEAKKLEDLILDIWELNDRITPIFLGYLEKLTDREKHIIYALIMRPLRVKKKDLIDYLTIGDLVKELDLKSNALSVTINRLVTEGIIQKRLKDQKNNEYNITDQIFIDWFIFRNRKI